MDRQGGLTPQKTPRCLYPLVAYVRLFWHFGRCENGESVKLSIFWWRVSAVAGLGRKDLGEDISSWGEGFGEINIWCFTFLRKSQDLSSIGAWKFLWLQACGFVHSSHTAFYKSK